MSALVRRRALVVAALGHIAAVVFLFGEVDLSTFNMWLASTAVSMVWLLWVFCQWSAHQHARRWARDIEKVHGGRPRPMPERAR